MRGRIIASFVLLGLVASCTKEKQPQQELRGPIRIVGSTNVVPLLQKLADPFKKANPKVTFDWRASNTNYAFGDPAINADLVAAIRLPKDKEKEMYGDPLVLGRDGLCLILHKSNKVSTLTKDQLMKLMSATALPPKWSEVGGDNIDVRAIMPSDPRHTMTLLLGYFGVDRSQLAFFSNEAGNDQAIEGVKGDPTAIAAIGCSAAKRAAKSGAVKMLPIGSEPTPSNIAAGKVDIPFTLYLAPNKAFMEKKPQVKAFFEFAKDKANVEPLIKEFDLAPPA